MLWPPVGIFGSIIVGAIYGFLAPIMATFDAVGEGKANNLIHCFLVKLIFLGCEFLFIHFLPEFYHHTFPNSFLAKYIQDGTWSTIKGSCTVVRDVKDICLHSYFSIMDDLRLHDPPNGEPYEIR